MLDKHKEEKLDVDEATLNMIASALPRLSLGMPRGLRTIRVSENKSELIFVLASGEELVVTVSQDQENFLFRLEGRFIATIKKSRILGRIH
jgi:hypothetical protein